MLSFAFKDSIFFVKIMSELGVESAFFERYKTKEQYDLFNGDRVLNMREK